MADPINAFLHNTHIAYFTMEIALRSEIHTYSGGLGILAGDTARSCADLQLPVVFLSLASRSGYLRQELDDHGNQIDRPDPWDPGAWTEPLDAMIAIELAGRQVWIRPWLHVLTSPLGSRVPVILLDTDLDQNDPADRTITDRLYGGDLTNRLRQEAVLGIGGVRILQALGFIIRSYHMNEGHSAFLTTELLRHHPRPTNHIDSPPLLYDPEHVVERCIFTTHTPVEAGHDRFPYDLVEHELGSFIAIEELKRYAGSDDCNMTKLALALSGYVNGVAQRHAETTERMFPGYHVRAITNGVHVASWAHNAFAHLFTAHFPHWSHEPEVLFRADQLPDDAIWQAHMQAKAELIDMTAQKTGVRLDPDRPIIGFARRMTGYKRPELIFSDLERLEAIHTRHPFQIVWAGKAHPDDLEGKQLIAEINDHIAAMRGKIEMAFLPNYDLDIARTLVGGADIWLNTPLPPLEASGTSGMKASVNGVLNLSILDGWWVEGWIEGVTGWSIGTDLGHQGEHHASDLYDKLEGTVLPLFYEDRARWIWMMKQSISKLASYFNSQRMMRRYATEAYLR
ncbi:alpha-glucan family phosphorylase [Sphingobium nicotianae]|uniref:Alpha-glucan family phosphorylase n=1 Tax=Sphingobium nicotianae TaxID=2782607 RepID=A0A9X1D9Y4_9SPHN|nr:alpha-glucan family phosphorylase [Sphingobium nicotianae]MBT2186107.1 alpha-glucan family phosphorylase [Sphingobium nicotianae]